MTDNYLSCNAMGHSPAQLLSGLLRSAAKLPDGFGFSDSDIIYTHQGRYAIQMICQLFNICPGDEVLVPAYNCGAEVDPFLWAGAKVIFYRIDTRAEIDKADILKRVTPATRLIYVSHFFGWPQDIQELAQWCKDKNIFLVEDCALALFSKDNFNNALGRTGDAAIFSFVKSLPLPDGGALLLNNQDYISITKPETQPSFKHTFLNDLPLLKKWFMHENTFWQKRHFTRNLLNKSWLKTPANQTLEAEREMPQSNYFDPRKIGWSVSDLAKGLLCQTKPFIIIEKRRENCRYLFESLSFIPDIQCLYDNLPDNVCPLSFPIYVNNRQHWFHELGNRGILAGGWPSYHRCFDWKDFPEARRLKNNLITLPVHQYLSLHHMKYISNCVKSIAGAK